MTAADRSDVGCDRVEIRLLGPIEIQVGDAVQSVPGRQTRAVLAAIALRHPAAISADELAEAIWPDDRPERWEASLYAHISRLRRLLGGHRLLRGATGYRLAVDRSALDIHMASDEILIGFGALDRGDADGALRPLATALSRWRGPALRELEDLPFADDAARRCTSLRSRGLEALLDASLATGHLVEAAGVAEVLVRDEPWNEDAWAKRVTALVRAGRLSDARRILADAVATLQRELGAPGRILAAAADEVGRAAESESRTHAGAESATPPVEGSHPSSRETPDDSVDPETRWVVTVLAVAGTAVSPDLLASASGLGPPALLTALDRARRAGWLGPDGPLELPPDRAAVVLRRLGGPERALVQRRLATAASGSSSAGAPAATRWALGAIDAGHPFDDALRTSSHGIVEAVRRGDLMAARELADLVAEVLEGRISPDR